MNTILSALQETPKQYGELRQIVPAPMLDYQLRKLLKERKVQFVYDSLGTCRFSVSAPQPPDEPFEVLPRRRPYRKTRSGPKRPCHRCLEHRYETQFGTCGNGKRGKICNVCRHADKLARKGGEHEKV